MNIYVYVCVYIYIYIYMYMYICSLHTCVYVCHTKHVQFSLFCI